MKKVEIMIIVFILFSLSVWSLNELETIPDKNIIYKNVSTTESVCSQKDRINKENGQIPILRQDKIDSIKLDQTKDICLYYRKNPDGNPFDLGSFFGALLGAIISGIVAIGVFWQSNRRLKKTKHEETRQTLAVFSKFIDVVKENVDKVKECIEKYRSDVASNVITIYTWTGFPEYFLNRIRNIDVIKISKAFFEFNLTDDDCTNYIKEIEYLNVILHELDSQYYEYNNEMEAKIKTFIQLESQVKDYLWDGNCTIEPKRIEEIKQLYPSQGTMERYTYTVMLDQVMIPLNNIFFCHKIDNMVKITEEALLILKQMESITNEWKLLFDRYLNDMDKAISALMKVKSNINEQIKHQKGSASQP
ncbi:MAG: hypothetical protein LBL79_11510 [Prevotella sp.]|jgi:hypothetical protein|nr:hypothetical protein [Prevotella sp.]